MTTIKVNGKTITISGKSIESFDTLDKESKALESLAIDISKSIEALNIVSNIKAMESFGYKSTEGIGENIKNAATVIKNKIIEWFKKFIDWLKRIRNWIKEHLFKKKINNIKNPKFKQTVTTTIDEINKLSEKSKKYSDKIVTSTDDMNDDKIKNSQNAMRQAQVVINVAVDAVNTGANDMVEWEKRINEEMKNFDEEFEKESKSIKESVEKALSDGEKRINNNHIQLHDDLKTFNQYLDKYINIDSVLGHENEEILKHVKEQADKIISDVDEIKSEKEDFKKYEPKRFEPKRFEVNRFEPTKF